MSRCFSPFALLLLLCVGAEAEPVRAVLQRIHGTVEIRPSGGSWRRVNERERVSVGTSLRTAEGSWAVLRLSARNLVRMDERTEITIDRSESRRDPQARGALPGARGGEVHTFEISLPNGALSSVLRGLRSGARFDLSTPIATAGVRGTSFSTTVTGPAPPVPNDILRDFEEYCENLANAVNDGMVEERKAGEMIGIRYREIAQAYGVADENARAGYRIRRSFLHDMSASYYRAVRSLRSGNGWFFLSGFFHGTGDALEEGEEPPEDPFSDEPEEAGYRVAFVVREGEITVSGGIVPSPVQVGENQSLVVSGVPGRTLPHAPAPRDLPAAGEAGDPGLRSLDRIDADLDGHLERLGQSESQQSPP